MDASFLSEILLPLSLFIVMAGIGLSLKLSDFVNVIKFPRTVLIGLLGQFVLLPVLALAIFYMFPFPSALVGAGFIIIALAPGGATSNLFTHLARGEVASSISLTSIGSLITPFTLPFLAAALIEFVSPGMIQLPIGETIIQLAALTFVPVGLGMAFNRFFPNAAAKMHKPVGILSLAVLFLVIAGIMAQTWSVFTDNFASMILPTLALLASAFGVAYLLSRVTGVSTKGQRSVTFEVGLQNGTVALLVTASILQVPETTIAAMFYSVLMFPAAFIALFLFRRGEEAVSQPSFEGAGVSQEG